MPRSPRRIAVLAILLPLAFPAAAQEASDEGARLAAACAGCHGTAGHPQGDTIPGIGGLREAYIASSMRDYRSGARKHEEMERIARGYEDPEIKALAAWFAAQEWRPTATANDESLVREGLRAARNRCASCHGPRGAGGTSGPRLAGQPAAYLALASAAYRDGLRTGARARAKSVVMKGLKDETIEAVSHFYAGLKE